MSDVAYVSTLDSQYDHVPLILARDHAIFRTEFLAGCVDESKCTCSTRSDGKWSAAVTYVHDWDRDSKDSDAAADWKLLAKLTDFEAKAAAAAKTPVTVFYMEPVTRAKLMVRTIRCYRAPEKITMYRQLPSLAYILLSHRPVQDVVSALAFWPSDSKTNQLKLVSTGLLFGAPGRLSQNECRPRGLESERRRVTLKAESLALAIFACIHWYLVEQQVEQRNIDGLLHTTMHLVLNQDVDSKGAVFEDRGHGSAVPSHLRNNLTTLAHIIRATIKGEYAHGQIDPLFIAAAKRSNCMADVSAVLQRFSAIQTPEIQRAKRLQPCTLETKRIWRPRRFRPISLASAVDKLAKHYAFQASRELRLFLSTAPSGKRVSIIEIEGTAANSVCTALVRYIPKSAFFVFDFVANNLTPSTLLALQEEDLSVYHRGSAIRLFAEMRSNAYNAVKSDIDWEFLPLAPMLTGLVACNDRTPLACRVFVDTVRDWFALQRLPPANDAKYTEDDQRRLTKDCEVAVDRILAMTSRAPGMHPRVAAACIQIFVAILDADTVTVDEGCIEGSGVGAASKRGTSLPPNLITKARQMFGAQASSGRYGFVTTGPAVQAKLCKMIAENCGRFGSDAREVHVGILAQTSICDRERCLQSLANVLSPAGVQYTSTIPGFNSSSSNVYTRARLVVQQTLCAGVEGRTSLLGGADAAEGVHRLFVALACVEQKLHLDCMPEAEYRNEIKSTGQATLVVADMTSGDEGCSPASFVSKMILREPPFAIPRSKSKSAPGIWFCGFYFCAWTVDHDTDGGLLNQHLDLTDRAAFFNWVWRPKIMADQSWIPHGMDVFNQRARARGSETGTDYQSDDEMAPSRPADLRVPEVKRSPVLEPPPTSPLEPAAAAPTETKSDSADSQVADEEEEEDTAAAAPAAMDEEEEEGSGAGTGGGSPTSAPSGDNLTIFDVLIAEEEDPSDAVNVAAAAASAAEEASAASSSSRRRRSNSPRRASGTKRKPSRSPPRAARNRSRSYSHSPPGKRQRHG